MLADASICQHRLAFCGMPRSNAIQSSVRRPLGVHRCVEGICSTQTILQDFPSHTKTYKKHMTSNVSKYLHKIEAIQKSCENEKSTYFRMCFILCSYFRSLWAAQDPGPRFNPSDGRSESYHIGRIGQMDRADPTDRQRDRQTDRQTDRGTDRQTGRGTDRQTYRQAGRQNDHYWAH